MAVISAKKVAIISAIITLVSFIYKLTIGILATSLVMIIAAVPTLMVFICKAAFAKNMNQTRAQKKKAYLTMTIATTIFSALFIMFVILKVGGIDIKNENRFEGWIALLFIAFILLMFILSIINLNSSLDKKDIVKIGMRQITFVSALADMVMIQEFAFRYIYSLGVEKTQMLLYLNNGITLAIAVFMIIVPISMIGRLRKYKV